MIDGEGDLGDPDEKARQSAVERHHKWVEELMPYAKAVSAKSHQFDDTGNETKTDYYRMMKIVVDSGYRGFVGIEWEGGKPSEVEGIRLTQKLLERVREKLSA